MPETRVLSAREEAALGQRIIGGDEAALEELVAANLGLVKWIANDLKLAAGSGEDVFDDLVQEGAIALMAAARRFDPARGRFATYARQWIDGAIKRFLAEGAPAIPLPRKAKELVHELLTAESRLTENLGRRPGDDELACDLGWETTRVAEVREWTRSVVSFDELSVQDDEGEQLESPALASTPVEDARSDDPPGYSLAEVKALIEHAYANHVASLDAVGGSLEEPRLRGPRRRSSLLARLADLDRALERLPLPYFHAVELFGLKGLPRREIERLLRVHYWTGDYLYKKGLRWIVAYLNGESVEEVGGPRDRFWRSDLETTALAGCPVEVELWARRVAAKSFTYGGRSFPVRDRQLRGDGWLLSPGHSGLEEEDVEVEASVVSSERTHSILPDETLAALAEAWREQAPETTELHELATKADSSELSEAEAKRLVILLARLRRRLRTEQQGKRIAGT